MTRDQIARIFLFESGYFDNVREIKANPQHRLVITAYKAADKILAALKTAEGKVG